MTKLFGTSGIRGDAEKLFTNQFCFDIGRCFSKFLKKAGIKSQIIAVGMDPRPSSLRIKQAVLNGLDSDFKIFDEGIIPTPALNFFIKNKGVSGLMITGSHIEEKLNGLKFFVNNEEISKTDEVAIENLYAQEKNRIAYKQKIVILKKDNSAKNLYCQMLAKLAVGNFSNLQIVIDAGNGTQAKIIPEVLYGLGIRVSKLNCDLSKPMLARDTETDNAFPELRESVLKNKADLGIGFDADGDRAIFITETGDSLIGEQSCAIIAKESKEKTLVTPINTSSLVDYLGKKVIRTKVGVLYVTQAMKINKTNLGFESNGGLISGDIFFGRDAGSATIKMLNILAKTQKKLSQLAADLPKFYIFKDKIDCSSELNKIILSTVKAKYANFTIDETDGVKIYLSPDRWLLFRPSGNAPEFRVFAEAKTESEAKTTALEGMNLVKKIIKEND